MILENFFMDEKKAELIKKQTVIKEIGKILSSRRKEYRKKIDTISKILNIKSSHLIAIEDGSEDYFFDKTYQFGFVKTYARYLKIDLSKEFNLLAGRKKNTISNNENSKLLITKSDFNPNIKIIIPAIAIMLILLFSLSEYKKTREPEYFYNFETNTYNEDGESKVKIEESFAEVNEKKTEYKGGEKNANFILKQYQNNGNESYQSEKILEEVNHIAKNTTIKLSEINLQINFLFETWIEIFDINNNIVKSGIFYAGDSFALKIDDENTNYFIDTGNSGGFEILSNNELLPVLGNLGEVRKKVSLIEILEIFKKQKKEIR